MDRNEGKEEEGEPDSRGRGEEILEVLQVRQELILLHLLSYRWRKQTVQWA